MHAPRNDKKCTNAQLSDKSCEFCGVSPFKKGGAHSLNFGIIRKTDVS